MINLDGILLVGAVVVIAAILAARIGSRVGLPSLLLFLGLGMAMGENGIGVRFDDADLAHSLGFGALVLILAEGGLTTRWRDIRPAIGAAAVLATAGVVVSIGLMTLFGYYVLHLDLAIAVLLGAVTSPTDAAAVFSVLRVVPIPPRLRGVLEAESGLNDAPTVLVVVAASGLAVGQPLPGGVPGLIALVAAELAGGVVIGLGLEWLGVTLLRRVALPSSGLYPLATLVWTVFAYGAAAVLHTSGFAAVYVAVVDAAGASDVEVEAAPLDKISADLLQVRVPEGSRLAGVEIGELRLGSHSVVTLIIREREPFTPGVRDRIKIGDELLIVTPSSQRDRTEERLRELGRGGRLVRWQRTAPPRADADQRSSARRRPPDAPDREHRN